MTRKLSVTESQKTAQFFGHLRAQEMENGSAEVIVGCVAAVVGHVSMHQSPQALDRVKVRAVARNVMHLDPAPGARQPCLNQHSMMVPGIVEKDMNEPLAGIH